MKLFIGLFFIGIALAQNPKAGLRDYERRCVSCHGKHVVWPGERPVRWNAKAA